jgi:hypothetical protein
MGRSPQEGVCYEVVQEPQLAASWTVLCAAADVVMQAACLVAKVMVLLLQHPDDLLRCPFRG